MTDEPVFWRDMTHEQKGAILLAHHEGKVIEWTRKGGSTFSRSTAKGFTPVWSNDHAYRVRPDTTLAEALDAQPGFTADDHAEAAQTIVRRVLDEASPEAVALRERMISATMQLRLRSLTRWDRWVIVNLAIRALTPPADLADKVKEGRADG